jgi:hypothetical protein
MSCHYGCWFTNRCMGDDREEVVEFLAKERPEVDWNKRTNQELDLALIDIMDVDFKGPNHVKRIA